MDVELRTRRLLLRQPRMDDTERLTRLLNNFHIAGNLTRVPYPYALSDAETWMRARRNSRTAEEIGFTLDLPGEGMIGHCGFHPESGGPLIGYWLANPIGTAGFMTEAAAAIIAWYFETTKAILIASGVFAFNKPSLAVQRKLGFTQTGTSFPLLPCAQAGAAPYRHRTDAGPLGGRARRPILPRVTP